jgi:excinuclease ABC subunit C
MQLVVDLIGFLEGDSEPVVKRLEEDMHHAAGELEFERAARLRDRLTAVRKAVEKQQMVVEGGGTST